MVTLPLQLAALGERPGGPGPGVPGLEGAAHPGGGGQRAQPGDPHRHSGPIGGPGVASGGRGRGGGAVPGPAYFLGRRHPDGYADAPDGRLSGGGGFIRRLKRADAGTVPIVAVTANAFTEDIDRHHRGGHGRPRIQAHRQRPASTDGGKADPPAGRGQGRENMRDKWEGSGLAGNARGSIADRG